MSGEDDGLTKQTIAKDDGSMEVDGSDAETDAKSGAEGDEDEDLCDVDEEPKVNEGKERADEHVGDDDNEEAANDGADQLVRMLIERGYFHKNRGNRSVQMEIESDSMETYRMLRSHPSLDFSVNDGHCQLIPTKFAVNAKASQSKLTCMDDENDCHGLVWYHTERSLAAALTEQIRFNGGILSISDAARVLSLENERYLDPKSGFPIAQSMSSLLPKSFHFIDKKWTSDEFWEVVRQKISHQLQSTGRLVVAEIANKFGLSSSVSAFLDRIDGIYAKYVADPCLIPSSSLIHRSPSASNVSPTVSEPSEEVYLVNQNLLVVLINKSTVERVRDSALEAVRSLNRPSTIAMVCEQHKEDHWDPIWVVHWIQHEIDNLDGDLQMDSSKTTQTALLHTVALGATWVPHDFVRRQRELIYKFFSANGYMTADIANRQADGVLGSQMIQYMKEYVKERGNELWIIPEHHCVLTNHRIQTIQIAIQESAAASTFVVLEDYLPAEILGMPPVVEAIFDQTKEGSSSVLVQAGERAVVFSSGLVKTMYQTIVTPLIAQYAATHAKEIDRAARASSGKEKEECNQDKRAKSGKKRVDIYRKNKKPINKELTKEPEDELPQLSMIVPLFDVAKALIQKHPDIFPLDTENLRNDMDSLDWDNGDDDMERNSLVVSFCKRTIDSSTFRNQCDEAIKTELKRLQMSRGKPSRKETASQAEGEFEEPFVVACKLIQSVYKFLSLAANHFDEASMDAIKTEFLQGCCADLTSRMTQYCLFKNGAEGGTFTYCKAVENSTSEPDGVQSYCRPVDLSIQQYPTTYYFSCPPPREPLRVLRESLPGAVGASMVLQWALIGNDCYRGRIPKLTTEDDESAEDAGKIIVVRPDEFMQHIEENSLLLCGLPFKKLDRKSEKQLLASRKQLLQEQLKSATDPSRVVDLTIMLLMQQRKNIVVLGSSSLLRGPILSMLLADRKISKPILELLQSLANDVENNPSEDLVEAVRGCGLCRDIGKHSIDGNPI